ncbi:MAG: hypothetical protein AAFY73_11565 [Pseudomonadota bacterium]
MVNRITLTRRHVLATLSGGGAVMLCPALLNAQELDLSNWSGASTSVPIGQSSLVEAPAGPAELDVSTLAPGEVAVIARPNSADTFSRTGGMQYVGILRRTDDQLAAVAGNENPGGTQDPRYLVVNLVCPHRGKAVGITGDASRPFACTDRGGRHSSDFTAVGQGAGGASDASDWLSVPDYQIAVTDSGAVVSLA